MLARLETDFFVADRFEPAKYEGNLTVALSDVGEMVFLPLLPLFLMRMGMKWVLALGMACCSDAAEPFSADSFDTMRASISDIVLSLTLSR